MPPKKSAWLYCSACSCRFYANFEEEHSAQCGDICKVDSAESLSGTYVALKPVSNSVKREPVRQMYMVDMHPETMEMLGVSDFGCVEINSSCVCEVLPIDKVKKGCFELPKSTIKSHMTSGLQKISVLERAAMATSVNMFIRPVIRCHRDKEEFVSYLKYLLEGAQVKRGSVISSIYLQWDISIEVTSVSTSLGGDSGQNGADPGWVTLSPSNTIFNVELEGEKKIENIFSSRKIVSLDDLGGYREEKRKLKDFLTRNRNGDPSDSLLICGRKGSGKSSFGNAAGGFSAPLDFHVIGIREAIRYTNDQSLGVLKAVKDMRRRSGGGGGGGWCVFFFDDLHATCGADDGSQRITTDIEMSRQVLLALRFLLAEQRCLVLASCLLADGLQPEASALFNETLHLVTPTPACRMEIVLSRCLSTNPEIWSQSVEEEVAKVVADCHGFVAENLVLFCVKAELKAKVRARRLGESEVKVALEDLWSAYEYTRSKVPDFHTYAMVTTPVYWNDIVGYDDLKMKIRSAFEWPIKRPEHIKKLGLTPQRGVLLYGPPGCCKTMMARALATEFKLNFVTVRGSDLLSMYVGESEKNVRELFSRARKVAPSLLFFDEIDSVATKRSGSNEGGTSAVLSALLTEMDGLESMEGVTMLAATNNPSAIDKALLRFKRLGQLIYVRLPCPTTRRLLLEKEVSKMDVLHVDVDLLVRQTERFSGDELVKLCQEAGYRCLEENVDGRLETRHFLAVMESRRPATDVDSLAMFDRFESTSE